MRAMLALLLSAGNAAAACSDGAEPPMGLKSWSASYVDEATTAFTIKLESNLPKQTRMLSGYVSFRDALGERMGAIALPRDRQYPALSAYSITIKAGSLLVPRVLSVSPEDIAAVVCVHGVIYADGTRETFE